MKIEDITSLSLLLITIEITRLYLPMSEKFLSYPVNGLLYIRELLTLI
jgi:hypothetical protein